MIDTFPYLVLLILVIRSCTLSGAKEGLIYLFKPKWNDLLKKTDINTK
jgi:solute carrier family 6 amino acid transporter-like protein 5/7/9/14